MGEELTEEDRRSIWLCFDELGDNYMSLERPEDVRSRGENSKQVFNESRQLMKIRKVMERQELMRKEEMLKKEEGMKEGEVTRKG